MRVTARLPTRGLMLVAAAVILPLLLAAALLGVPGAARAHVLLALGVAPLIFSAMIYFTPVLTRGPGPGPALALAPAAAMVAGAGAVLGMSRGPGALVLGAALLALAATLGLAWWLHRRGARALLGAHPGLRWYQAALGCFALGLAAIVAAHLWPRAWWPLRALHLHLNLIGFVGLTAIGTLNVLLPTAGHYQDPGAGARLRRHWPWAAAGSVLIAAAAALGHPVVGLLGVLAWGYPLVVLSTDALLRAQLWGWHSAALGLGAALLGWLIVLIAGAAHGLEWWSGRQVLWLAAFGFLLPLITGALGVLLPVWLDPTGAGCRDAVGRLLRRHAGARVLAFAAAAVAAALSAHVGARIAAAAGVGAFTAATTAAVVACLRVRHGRR